MRSKEIYGRKINRKASEFQGMALKSEVFDKKAMQFKEEKVLVINSREFKLPSDISERKIKYPALSLLLYSGSKVPLPAFFPDIPQNLILSQGHFCRSL